MMGRYIRKSYPVDVYRAGDPLPEGWPAWSIKASGRDTAPVKWVVRERRGFFAHYFDDESFFEDYEAVS